MVTETSPDLRPSAPHCPAPSSPMPCRFGVASVFVISCLHALLTAVPFASSLSLILPAVLASSAAFTPISANDRCFFLDVPPPQKPVSTSQACLAPDSPGDAPDSVPWDRPAPRPCGACGRHSILFLGTKSVCGLAAWETVPCLYSALTSDASWLVVEFWLEIFFLKSIKTTIL